MDDQSHIVAHEHTNQHWNEILKSNNCGCFFCLRIFSPLEILEWTDNESTAICPYCSIDSVIGSASGFPITKDFLSKMERHWFGMQSYGN
jgi:hypothetical protein